MFFILHYQSIFDIIIYCVEHDKKNKLPHCKESLDLFRVWQVSYGNPPGVPHRTRALYDDPNFGSLQGVFQLAFMKNLGPASGKFP